MHVGFARVIWAEYIAGILLLTATNAPEPRGMWLLGINCRGGPPWPPAVLNRIFLAW